MIWIINKILGRSTSTKWKTGRESESITWEVKGKDLLVNGRRQLNPDWRSKEFETKLALVNEMIDASNRDIIVGAIRINFSVAAALFWRRMLSFEQLRNAIVTREGIEMDFLYGDISYRLVVVSTTYCENTEFILGPSFSEVSRAIKSKPDHLALVAGEES